MTDTNTGDDDHSGDDGDEQIPDYRAASEAGVREVIIRYDPRELDERRETTSVDEMVHGPAEIVRSMADEDQFETIRDTVKAVVDVLSGHGHHDDITLVVCEECGAEATVGDAAFPGGRNHTTTHDADDSDDDGEEREEP